VAEGRRAADAITDGEARRFGDGYVTACGETDRRSDPHDNRREDRPTFGKVGIPVGRSVGKEALSWTFGDRSEGQRWSNGREPYRRDNAALPENVPVGRSRAR
jgi:hypothetical protein